MPFTYCTECGYKNVFTTRRAKFCAGCGQSLVEEANDAKSKPQPDLQSAQANLEDAQSQGVPNIQKLEYTVDQSSKSFTIGDLINTKDEGTERLTRKQAQASSTSLTKEEVEAESMRICASSAKNRSTD